MSDNGRVNIAEDVRPVVSSVSDLLTHLAPITAAGNEMWFRGHRDQSWLLLPSTYRTAGHRMNERAMIARFRQEAAAVVGLQHPMDEWGWIAFAQHHSLPTRLLDWSQTPLVGLYFACEKSQVSETNPTEPDGEFFVLDPHGLNDEAGDVNGGHPRLLTDADTKLQDYLPGRDLTEPARPRAVVSPQLFDRIRFQTGTFTVSQQSLTGGVNEQLRRARSIQSFVVPASAKDELRAQLETLGLNEVSIYRDVDRVAKRIGDNHRSVS